MNHTMISNVREFSGRRTIPRTINSVMSEFTALERMVAVGSLADALKAAARAEVETVRPPRMEGAS